MSRSSENGDGAKTRKKPGVPQTQDNDVASPADEGGPGAVVDRIRRIAAELDVDNLNEEDLVALSDGALHLVDVAKTQSVRKRDIAFCLAQVDDWEVRHADTVADTEVVARAVAALRKRIDACEVDGDAVSAALDLLEGYISADADYSAIHKQLRQAAADADFELVRSLNETLESLAAERNQASVALDEVPSKPHSPEPTPRKPPADRPEAPEHETGEAPDSLDEDQPATDQAKPSELVPSEGETEAAEDATGSAGDDPTAAEDETESSADDAAAGKDEVKDGQPDTAHEVSPRPDDGKATAKGAADPSPVADDDEEESVPSIADAVAMSIERSRFALAYHLSLSAPEALPSANAIKLAAYNYVTDERATVAAELAELAAALHHKADAGADEGPGWRSHVLFTTCAALAPALAAPGGPVAQLLAFFDPWLGDTPSLRALAKTAADVSMTGVHLPTNLLREEDSLERWRERESWPFATKRSRGSRTNVKPR